MVLPLDDDVTKFSKLWTYVTSYYYVGSGYTYQHGVCLSVAPRWETRVLHYEVWLPSCLNIAPFLSKIVIVVVPTHFNMVTCMATISPSAAPTGKPEYCTMKLWRPSCLSKLGTWGTVCAY